MFPSGAFSESQLLGEEMGEGRGEAEGRGGEEEAVILPCYSQSPEGDRKTHQYLDSDDWVGERGEGGDILR